MPKPAESPSLVACATTAATAAGFTNWRSLEELNDEAPHRDHWSTVDNLAGIYNASSDLRCWQKTSILVAEIDPFQLIDDADDWVGQAKIESIRLTPRSGDKLTGGDHGAPQ
jgi:hypothetical protein